MSSSPTLRGRAWLLHGFNVWDGGEGSIDKFIPALVGADFDVVEFDYGWLGPVGVKAMDGRLAKLLAKLVRPGDVVIAHSNGCCIAQMAADLGAPFAVMVFISPALDRDAPLPAHIGERHVWHTPSDEWVTKARWIPFVKWGDMGAVGYQGDPSTRTINFNGEVLLGIKPIRHSGWFEEPPMPAASRMIVGKMLIAHLRITSHVPVDLLPSSS